MSQDTSCGGGKDGALSQKDPIIGLHQANKTTKEETANYGLRTARGVLKICNDSRTIIFGGRNVAGRKY